LLLCFFSVADAFNYTFVTLFTIEMFIKMYGLGLRKYFSSMFNRFDALVVVFSVIEIILIRTTNMPQLGVSVLRCARLLRVFRVTRSVLIRLTVRLCIVRWVST